MVGATPDIWSFDRWANGDAISWHDLRGKVVVVRFFDADHPEIFAAEDNGATPVELVLTGLASCLTAGIASVAQMRDIQLNSVAATLEGEMDLQGILGIDSDVRNGFGGIKAQAYGPVAQSLHIHIVAGAGGFDSAYFLPQSGKVSR